METLSDKISGDSNLENDKILYVNDVQEIIKQLREDFKGFIFPSNKLINKIIDVRLGKEFENCVLNESGGKS